MVLDVEMDRYNRVNFTSVYQLIKNRSHVLYEHGRGFSAGTELKTQNAIGPILELFYQDFLLFVDNHYDFSFKRSTAVDSPRELFTHFAKSMFTIWNKNWTTNQQNQQNQRKEIIEIFKEIIATIIPGKLPGNDKYQLVYELIPSDQVRNKCLQFRTRLYKRKRTDCMDNNRLETFLDIIEEN